MTDGGVVRQIIIKSIEKFKTIRTQNAKVASALKHGLDFGKLKDPKWLIDVLRNTDDEGDSHE